MARLTSQSAFTLVEVVVAILLLSAIALALTNTLVSAQHARSVSERWLQATQLAAEGIEQLRAGNSVGPVSVDSGFARSGSASPWAGHSGVYRLDVRVSWNDGRPQDLQLSTLVRR